MTATYKGASYPIASCDFEEQLIGLKGVAQNEPEAISWVRCENLTLAANVDVFESSLADVSKRDQIIACLEVSRQAKKIPWPHGIGVTLCAEYSHKTTRRIGVMVAADQDENEVDIWFDQHNRWGGTIQDLQREFDEHPTQSVCPLISLARI